MEMEKIGSQAETCLCLLYMKPYTLVNSLKWPSAHSFVHIMSEVGQDYFGVLHFSVSII